MANEKQCSYFAFEESTGDYTNRCPLFSENYLCTEHTKKRKIDWENYHLLPKKPKISLDVSELELRAEFRKKYHLSCDYGHTMWNEYLQSLIHSYETCLQIDIEANMQHLYVVYKQPVCLEKLKKFSMLALDSSVKYEEEWGEVFSMEHEKKRRIEYLDLTERCKKIRHSPIPPIDDEEW